MDSTSTPSLHCKDYFSTLLVWLAPTSALGWWIFNSLIPQHAFPSYFAIPLIMLCMGLAFYFLLRKVRELSVRTSFMWFIINTVFKMIVSVVFIFLTLSKDRESLVPLGLTYSVFYLMLLSFETSWYMRMCKSCTS